MRITSQTMQARALLDLQRTQTQIARTQQQISSGDRLAGPSDDPVAARRALETRRELAAIAGQKDGAAAATSWNDATDTALQTVTDTIHRVRELVTKAATASTNQTDRLRIKDELDGLIGGLKDAMNAKVGDQYVFAGTATTTRPYGTATDAYAGNSAAVTRVIGPGVAVQVNTPGDAILGQGQTANDGKLLDTLRDIGDHLTLGDVTSLGTSDLQALTTNLDAVSSVRATLGATQTRVDAAVERLGELETTTTTRLSDLTGTDYGKAILDLNAQSTAYQAALKSTATVIQPSLLDFLR